MAIVLHFVDIKGCIQEHVMDLVHVKDASAATLFSLIYAILSHHSLDVQNLRGQDYDGASNM